MGKLYSRYVPSENGGYRRESVESAPKTVQMPITSPERVPQMQSALPNNEELLVLTVLLLLAQNGSSVNRADALLTMLAFVLLR